MTETRERSPSLDPTPPPAHVRNHEPVPSASARTRCAGAVEGGPR
ncbi:hypothetical protein O7599_03635 [Streptomyces sp. WMMC500]|nr:hypothetical protein [Streptomyces sp. WMMC500]WBB61659.1 hypothetical protein O7599_03635 [Streptomyces sp. WMMC500]